METSEIFLLVWACLATTLAVLYREGGKKLLRAHRELSVLVAELALGEIKPTQEGDYTVVENDSFRLKFIKRND
jgi:hypothetical protein